jgi:hypothetical protein
LREENRSRNSARASRKLVKFGISPAEDLQRVQHCGRHFVKHIDLVDLPECDALGGRAGRMQGNRTGDQGEFEVAFPVGTHNKLLWLGFYAGEAACRHKQEALFETVAGCKPS